MDKKDPRYQMYVSILREELLLAMGCTEPAAVAYCAALARSLLDAPEKIQHCTLLVSGNIIKNVKSVVVPNTCGMKGLKTAVAAGAAEGDETAGLQVLSHIGPSQQPNIQAFLERCPIEVLPAESPKIFYIEVTLFTDRETARVVIEDYHTNVTVMEHNGHAEMRDIRCGDCAAPEQSQTDRTRMNVEDILDFAATADLTDVQEVLNRQIQRNMAISEEGLRGQWGAQVGRTMMKAATSRYQRAAAAAAAGSDARMSGCELPVVIVSGSGNQGLTASVPVIICAREMEAGEDALLRALLVSNLITIHQKTGIGRLSAFCGATSAGVGAACGIAWLEGGRYQEIAHTIVNSLAILSGMVCDGAKPSCAAKIATAVTNGLLGYQMFCNGLEFFDGDGIVTKGVENTIANVGRLANRGMRQTDREILNIMTGR